MDRIRGSLVDGRIQNVRYRQDQLHQLHTSLRHNADRICEAISERRGMTKGVAETEFFLAMDSIDKAYQTLDFDQSLKAEYSVQEGKDNLSRRVGVGLIAIRPGTNSRLYSIMTPLAMAIAAGNCVFLEIENSNSAIDALLKEILPKALDRDLLAISSKFTESEISDAELFLDEMKIDRGTISTNSRVTTAKSLAVIDRSANLKLAAKDIVNSRLSPNDCSPYSPDLIIVNEFAKEEFIRICIEYSSSTEIEKRASTTSKLRESLAKLEKAGQVTVTQSPTSNLTIVEIRDRSCSLASTKISGPYLVILPSTSVTDTITSQLHSPENICTYIFANPSTAKFISEQISSVVSYVNQIPQQLLIGPISSPHSLHPRYTTDMFSRSRPTIIAQVPDLPKALKEEATKPLKPTGQKMGHAVGFFEQGIFLGLGVTVFVVLPITSWFLWKAGKRTWELLR